MEKQQRKNYFARDATGLTREVGSFYAMIGNIMVMGLGYGLVFAFFSSSLYPGVDLPYTVAFALIPAFILSAVYYLFTVAMPRTGGDFVWVSRILNPAAGFVGNVLITFTLVTTNGVVAAWIVLYGLTPMLAGLGIVNSNASLVTLAVKVSTLPYSFIISLIVLCVFLTPLFLSTRNVFRYLTVVFGIALISTLILIGAFLSAPHSTFLANFNRLSGMNDTTIVNAATGAGIPSGFVLSATLTGGVFTIINFLGFNNSAYYGGEVKHAEKSQLFGMFAAVLLGAGVIALLYGAAYYSIGSGFLTDLSYLSSSLSPLYTASAAPTLNFLAVFSSPNPFVVVAASIALIATSVGSITAFTFVCVRNVFAWSFDRLLPSWLTNIDSKRGSPYASVILLWIISILTVVGYYYTIFFQFYIYSALAYFIAYGFVSVAAIIFPYKKKAMFESAPSVVKTRVGGVPLITILGVAGLVASIFIAYSSVTPAVTPLVGSALVKDLAYAIVPLTIVVSLVIYTISYLYRKSRGINLDLTFKEIPPE